MALIGRISPELTCSICKDIYALPKSLPCGHTFCDQCITPLVNNNKVKCALCREEAPVPNQGFNTNFVLNNIVSKYYGNNLKVIKSNMSASMKATAKQFTWQCKEEEKMSKAIVEKMNEKYGKHWNCLVEGHQPNYCLLQHIDATLCSKLFIELHVEGKKVCILKSCQDDPCWKCGENFCDGTKCNLEVKVMRVSNQKTDVAIIQVKQIILNAVKEQPEMATLSQKVTEELSKLFGGQWMCFIGRFYRLDWTSQSFCHKALHIELRIGHIYINILKVDE